MNSKNIKQESKKYKTSKYKISFLLPRKALKEIKFRGPPSKVKKNNTSQLGTLFA